MAHGAVIHTFNGREKTVDIGIYCGPEDFGTSLVTFLRSLTPAQVTAMKAQLDNVT